MTKISTQTDCFYHNFESLFGPATRVDPGSDWPGAGTGPSWKKNKKTKNSVWPGNSVANPLTFILFYENNIVLIKKKLTQPAQ